MSFEPGQFRRVIIYALNRLSERASSPEAVEMLMMTAAQETHLGRYLFQVNLSPVEGGACGVFQMEPATHDDVQERLVVGKYPWMPLDNATRMIWDLRYAVWMARIYYMQFPEPFPPKDEIAELAHYYKQYWNTPVGKAQVPDVVKNYYSFVVEP